MSSAPAGNAAPCVWATLLSPVPPNHPSAPSADTPRDDYSSARDRTFRHATLYLGVRHLRERVRQFVPSILASYLKKSGNFSPQLKIWSTAMVQPGSAGSASA